MSNDFLVDGPNLTMLTNDALSLVPVNPDDYRFLYWVATAGDNRVRWRYRMQIPPFEVFVQQVHQDTLAQFVVWERSAGVRIGHALAYSADLRNQTTYVGCVLSPEYIGTGFGRQALDLLVDYLTRTWRFRKIYAEVPAFTFDEFGGHEFGTRESNRWVHEATLSEHLYCDGRFWDMHIVSMPCE